MTNKVKIIVSSEKKTTIKVKKLSQKSLNYLKRDNYSKELLRLKRSMKEEFYLESIVIECGIIQDRLESVLLRLQKITIESCTGKTKELGVLVSLLENVLASDDRREDYVLVRKYITLDNLRNIKMWSLDRNRLFHQLMRPSSNYLNRKLVAIVGYKYMMTLKREVQNFNRSFDKKFLQPSN